MKRDCTKEEVKMLEERCGKWGSPRFSMGDPDFAQSLQRNAGKFSGLETVENEEDLLFQMFEKIKGKFQGLLN